MTTEEFNQRGIAEAATIHELIRVAWESEPQIPGVLFEEFPEGIGTSYIVNGVVHPLQRNDFDLESPRIHLIDVSKDPTTWDQAKQICQMNGSWLMRDRIQSATRQVPAIPGTIPSSLGSVLKEGFVRVEFLHEARYSDRWDEEPIPHYVQQETPGGMRYVPNPEWQKAPFYDEVSVEPGWLKVLTPRSLTQEDARPFGEWKWINIPDSEFNPRGEIGYLRGMFVNTLVPDPDKILRIRRPRFV